MKTSYSWCGFPLFIQFFIYSQSIHDNPMTALNVFFLHCTNVQATASPAIQATASPAIQSSGSRGYLFRQHYLPQLLCDEVTKKGMEQVSPCLYCILSTGAGGGGGGLK